MLYIICPSCGELLGTQFLNYCNEIDKLKIKYNIEDVNNSVKNINNFNEDRATLLNNMFTKGCCKMRYLTFIEIGEVIQ